MNTKTKQTENLAECGNKSKPLLSSRLFKFRVWDSVDKEMTPFDEIRILPNETMMYELFTEERYNWMQFTGILDINKKLIYEGDIVNDEELGKGIVVFQSGCFFMMYDADTNMEFLGLKTDRFGRLQEKRIVEILGNIYENPELL